MCDRLPMMVVVPAGKYTMGSPESEKDRLGINPDRTQ
jgi:hypothetical protein